MRLTLRTLLAYLDDILEPAQAKEIGAKIAESGFASGLVNRIREVMRKRRLTAPELEGPQMGLDPNTVAEYLDNTLPPESIADVERVCLESDVHLAEVAACHQILALVLGEPVEIPRDSRARMYALGPISPDPPAGTPQAAGAVDASKAPAVAPLASTSPEFRAVPADPSGHQIGKLDTPKESAPAAVATPAAGRSAAAPSFEESIPSYLRPRPLWKRALPYVAVVLLIGVWVGLLSLDGSPFAMRDAGDGGPTPAGQGDGAPQVAAVDVDQPIENIDPLAPQDDGPAPGGAGEMLVADRGALPSTVGPENIPIDRPPPADADDDAAPVVDQAPPASLVLPETAVPATPKGVGEAPAVAVAPTDSTAIPAVPAIPAQPAEPDNVPPAVVPPAADAPPAARTPELQYNSVEGIVLRYDDRKQDWMVLRHRALVRAGDRLAVPDPFEAVLDAPSQGVRVKFMAETSARILPPNEAANFGFAVRRGRVVLERIADAAAQAEQGDKPIPVSIEVNGELWRVELLTADTRCGIEIIPRQPDQLDQDLGKNVYTGGLYVQRGSVRFADGSDKVHLQGEGGWYSLAPEDREQVDSVSPPLPAMPAWMAPNADLLTSIQRRAATQFEREFDPVRPLTQNIDPIVNDQNPNLSGLATRCLALVEDYRQLVRALRSDHEDTRLAAILGLRTWLPTHPDNGKRLEEQLKLTFQPDDVRTAYRLLWGFNEQDAQSMLTSNELVLWLDHPEIAIRELAFFHVYRLTGRRNNYRPNLPPSQLKTAVLRWTDHVAKTGALVAPSPK